MAKVAINLSTGSLQQEEIIVGIDLGTTNSLVAYIHPDTRQPLAINDQGRGTIVPSVVHFPQGGEDPIVGTDAKSYLLTDPQNTIYSVKRLLGKSYQDLGQHASDLGYKVIDDNSEGMVKIRVGDKFYSPIELSAEILKELRTRAEHALKTPVNKAVITVPAYFNDSQRQATRDAGRLAGLEVLRIVNEPTAAALAYGVGLSPDEEKTVAVYDLGGGTFDVSILRIQQGIFEVLSTNGDTYLGGDDIDRAIIEYWSGEYQLATVLFQNSGAQQELRLLAESAKKHLSQNEEFAAEFGGTVLPLTKAKFNELIAPLVERTLVSCRQAMADAKLTPQDLNAVLLVGGSTRVPLVYDSVSEYFQQPANNSLNPDEVVALGAAIQADILGGNRRDVLLLDVTPLTLGIETLGGLMDPIIPRNSKIPTKAGRQYTTSVDGQVNLKISVYQGERDLVKENRKLAEFDLRGIPAMPAGLPKVDVNFILNADGILKVEAIELRSNTRQAVEIKPQYGLTDEQVEQMLMDSMTHAREDIAARMVIEARTVAEQMLYQVERFVSKNGQHLTAEETSQTTAGVEKLKAALATQEKDTILKAVDELEELTRPFAERVMNISISQAMAGKKIE
ncbi:Fe-S protein assembly chaperone HscA [Hymenobacter taeanensis]|uniref:Fe-S protein assembly chaperone HscA n=1 Tax=Hymenobacter taeanensis TaxID=2735321 RepID=A0A6M6BDR9_9BACT|nr:MULTISPECIES: Fe-S protein assembly chaperone HscA [Hymenobacter]QJX46112.1 Fe-S protein assembly chaperone HscA [Hymenobacter taeanensis]UOQ79971.1 Fe-S protein assembly chaperone HscA [Hymenobacter sp. 5414T-23]